LNCGGRFVGDFSGTKVQQLAATEAEEVFGGHGFGGEVQKVMVLARRSAEAFGATGRMI